MRSKKILAAILACCMALTLLTGCQSAGAASDDSDVPTVTLWGSGSDLVRVELETIAEMFNSDPEYSKKAHLEIQFILSGTGEASVVDRMAAAYESGQTDTDFDLIAMDENYVSTVLSKTSADFLEPIDTSLVPNLANVEFKSDSDTFVGYRGTCVYLAYNSETVPNPPTNAEELYQWIKDHPGRFAYNVPSTGGAGLSFLSTALYNPLPEEAATSDDEKWVEQWGEGFALLEELHPYLYQSAGKVQYPQKNQGTLDLLANKEIDMCPAFADMVFMQKDMGTMPDSIELIQIEPAFTGNLVGFFIPEIGKDKEAAHAVIDFFLTPEAQATSWDTIFGFPVLPSAEVPAEKNKDWLENTNISSFRAISNGALLYEEIEQWDEKIGQLG